MKYAINHEPLDIVVCVENDASLELNEKREQILYLFSMLFICWGETQDPIQRQL